MNDLDVFIAALDVPEAEQDAFIQRVCAGDKVLLRKVQALLQAHKSTDDFLDRLPIGDQPEKGSASTIGGKAGDRIGRYKLLQQIGEGGWGIVFMAEQEEPVRRRVALKIVKPGMDTKSVIARFEAERQALALMEHPNIAHVFDAGATDSGRPYFVMELVRGTKVTDYCDQHSLTTTARLELFTQICEAVQHAHQKGIIHRDIKPSNILVATTGDGSPLPKVIDFGIAKATTNQRLTDKTLFTAFEMLIGTPAYMSPEQAALTSVDVDTRTDIYSLGVLLYELLTGTTPFDARALLKAGLDEVRRVIQTTEPVRPSTRLVTMVEPQLTTLSRSRQVEPQKLIREVRGDLDWIVMKALEKDPGRRYATANSLAMDLRRYAAGDPVSARPPSRLYRFQKILLRNKLLFAGIATLVMLLVASLILVSTLLARERRALHDSERDKQKAQQVTIFLEDMLQGVGPSVAVGRDTAMLREILNRTAERVGAELTNQPAVEAELRSVMGRMYYELASYDQAEQMQRKALAISRKMFGDNSKEFAESLDNLGLTLWRIEKQAEAEAADVEALAIRRRLFGNEHPDVATSLNHLADVYRHYGKPKEAEPLAGEALVIRQKWFGRESLEAAESLRIISILLGDESKWPEAEARAREVLAIRRKLLGREHPGIVSSLADVAWAARGNGKLEEANSLERESLAMRQSLLRMDRPDIAKYLYLLGENMRQREDLKDACSILNATLAIQQVLLGEDAPGALETMESLALTLQAQRKFAESESIARRALAIWRKRGDSGTPRALHMLASLGTALEAQGKWGEAEDTYREASSGWRKCGEAETPQFLSQAENLSRVLMMQKQFGNAETLLDETLNPKAMQEVSSASLLITRAELKARRSRWEEAAADASLSLHNNPQGTARYALVGALLAKTRNLPAYEEFCKEILTRCGDTTNIFVADQVAKACLFLPSSNLDLQRVGQVADRVATLGAGDEGAMPFFSVCKSLAEYRRGRYAEAAEWARKALTASNVFAHGPAYAVLAMADWRLGHVAAAREALTKGEALAPAVLPPDVATDPGDAWKAWLFARVSLDEAAALFQSSKADDDDVTKH